MIFVCFRPEFPVEVVPVVRLLFDGEIGAGGHMAGADCGVGEAHVVGDVVEVLVVERVD